MNNNKKTDLSEADFNDLYKPRDLGQKKKKRKKAEIELKEALERWFSEGGNGKMEE